jgi:hypothetical protein
MALKDEVPEFKAGTPDLGGQLRALAKVVLAQCEAIEALQEASAAPKAAATTKTTSAAATKAAAK